MTMTSKKDLQHFLKLAMAQVRHRAKQIEASPVTAQTTRSLQLLEDLIKEQVQTDEDSRSSTRQTR